MPARFPKAPGGTRQPVKASFLTSTPDHGGGLKGMTLSGEPRKFRDAISLDRDSEVILHSDRGGQFISGTY